MCRSQINRAARVWDLLCVAMLATLLVFAGCRSDGLGERCSLHLDELSSQRNDPPISRSGAETADKGTGDCGAVRNYANIDPDIEFIPIRRADARQVAGKLAEYVHSIRGFEHVKVGCDARTSRLFVVGADSEHMRPIERFVTELDTLDNAASDVDG